MGKTVLLYGLALAAAAFVLDWVEYQYTVRRFTTETYVALIAIIFTVIGVWTGNRLTRRTVPGKFEKNDCALETLGITDREYGVLLLLAEGHSNEEIARLLFVSANTVKSHLAHLYGKLDVSRRTQAVRKARALRLIP